MQFIKFNKIPRLSREIQIMEKLDGSNGQIVIINSNKFYTWFEENESAYEEKAKEFFDRYCLYVSSKSEQEFDLYVFAGSRNRWLDTSSNGDNMGFAKWVKANAEELLKLGEGRHYGEWMGKGINRNYGLDEKRFALFNVGKWVKHDFELKDEDKRTNCPSCCDVVPILYEGMFDTDMITVILDVLKRDGSKAVPGYMNPEGIVIFHKASGQLFKKTIENDEKPKGE